MLQLRARTMQNVRDYFIRNNYLELDTPALSPDLIPETCLEVFRTDYIEPWEKGIKPLYLVPSPEIYIKKIIAQHKINVFQLSKCYRNVESIGRIHNPEFTMLEYYTMQANYIDSIDITESFFENLISSVSTESTASFSSVRPPFLRLTMDDAFERYAGFRLSYCREATDLALHALQLGLAEPKHAPFSTWPWDDLYELIFVQCVEQKLPKDRAVVLMDYPIQADCLAKDKQPTPPNSRIEWKERWELYCGGMEIANCYTEENDPEKIRTYFEKEGKSKLRTARVVHKTDPDYWKLFREFPECSGVALGFDRLLALLSGHTTIAPVLPFPL